jgi:hypothetical protein
MSSSSIGLGGFGDFDLEGCRAFPGAVEEVLDLLKGV